MENWTNSLYHLDAKKNGPNSFGDSLHHTSMIYAARQLQGEPMIHQQLKKFICYHCNPIRLMRYPDSDTRQWWVVPDTVTRDQTMAFVIAAWIFGAYKSECRKLYQNLVRDFGRFPNRLRNVTLEKKPWWERDIVSYDTLGLFYRATGLWYLWPFKLIGDLLLPFEALINALNKEKTDHVKFIVKVIAMVKLEKNFFADLASFIFVNLRRNNAYTSAKQKGHPVLDVMATYWQPEAGHDPKVFEETFRPLLEWWIKRGPLFEAQ